MLALTLKKHASLSVRSKKDYLTFTVLLVSGLRKRSLKWRDPLLGLGTWPVNGTCQLTLAVIFSRHRAEKMLRKSGLAAGTHLNRIKVICGMFCSYTVFSAYINLLPAWKKNQKAAKWDDSLIQSFFKAFSSTRYGPDCIPQQEGFNNEWGRDHFRWLIYYSTFYTENTTTPFLKQSKKTTCLFLDPLSHSGIGNGEVRGLSKEQISLYLLGCALILQKLLHSEK